VNQLSILEIRVWILHCGMRKTAPCGALRPWLRFSCASQKPRRMAISAYRNLTKGKHYVSVNVAPFTGARRSGFMLARWTERAPEGSAGKFVEMLCIDRTGMLWAARWKKQPPRNFWQENFFFGNHGISRDLRKLSTGLCTDSVYKSCGFFRQCLFRLWMKPASEGKRWSNCRTCLVMSHSFDQQK
jgi:hypothetical protein